MKQLKPAARRLLKPLIQAALSSQMECSDQSKMDWDNEDEPGVANVMMQIYLQPEILPGTWLLC